MPTPEQLYRNDPVFHQLVDGLEFLLREGRLSGEQLRQAVDVAITKQFGMVNYIDFQKDLYQEFLHEMGRPLNLPLRLLQDEEPRRHA